MRLPDNNTDEPGQSHSVSLLVAFWTIEVPNSKKLVEDPPSM